MMLGARLKFTSLAHAEEPSGYVISQSPPNGTLRLAAARCFSCLEATPEPGSKEPPQLESEDSEAALGHSVTVARA